LPPENCERKEGKNRSRSKEIGKWKRGDTKNSCAGSQPLRQDSTGFEKMQKGGEDNSLEKVVCGALARPVSVDQEKQHIKVNSKLRILQDHSGAGEASVRRGGRELKKEKKKNLSDKLDRVS